MKKLTLVLASLLCISYASALSCVDLKVGLTRRAESPKVLALQNFLYEKGYLKAVPNGYFGVGTLTAVKAYQKSLGLEQSGNVGPATRAAIKKESCSATSGQSIQTTQPNGTSITVTPAPAYTPPVPVVNTPSGLRNAKRREDLEKLLKYLRSLHRLTWC